MASNLFGDIISDIGAALMGGLGLAASASICPETGFALFEPVHGSAPDIAGTGVANPYAAAMSLAMLLDHAGHGTAAALLRRCLAAAARGDLATSDLGGHGTTATFMDDVMARLERELADRSRRGDDQPGSGHDRDHGQWDQGQRDQGQPERGQGRASSPAYRTADGTVNDKAVADSVADADAVDRVKAVAVGRRVPPPGFSGRVAAAGGSAIRDALALTARPEIISFAGGLPASDLIDADGIRTAYDQVLTESPHRVLQYSVTEGDPCLREAVADRLVRFGLASHPDDLLITTGAQQALALLTATLLEPGDTVLVENPTYLAALQCFAHAGARVVPVPTDDRGVVTDALADIVANVRPRLLYLVPTFQNPTGHTLPLERREAVARLAAEHGFWIAEDDPYGELRFRGERLPWIASLDAARDRCVLLGSLSKILAPGMRLGWLHGPAELRRLCVLAKQALDLHSSTVDQAAAARYLADHDLDAWLARAKVAYRERCDVMLAMLPDALPAGSTWSRPDGGMFVWVRLPAGFDAAALLPTAIAHDVAYVPGAPFFAGAPDAATLRISFAGHRPAEIEEGVRRLAEVFTDAVALNRRGT